MGQNNIEHVTYDINSQVKLKLNFMLKSSLCDYSDAYIAVKGNKTLPFA